MTDPAKHRVCRAPGFGEYTVVLGDRCTQNARSTPCPHREAHSGALEVPPLPKQIVVNEASSWVLRIVLGITSSNGETVGTWDLTASQNHGDLGTWD